MTIRNLKTRMGVLVIGTFALGLLLWSGWSWATEGNFRMVSPMHNGTIATPVKAETDGLVEFKTKQPVDILTVTLELPPGEGHSGWHTHLGPVLTVVGEGTVTEFDANCNARTLSKGEAFVDEAQDEPHIIRNTGDGKAILSLTAIKPEGARPFDPSPPAPASC